MADGPDAPEVLWTPDPAAPSRLRDFIAGLADEGGLAFTTYAELWQWSVDDLPAFWSAVWDFFGVQAEAGPGEPLPDASMPGARWFPSARLNYAEHALRGGGGLVSLSDSRDRVELSAAELREAVARARAGLVALGVGRGDRVAAYLPNVAESVVAFLATASIGAVWSSCAPEFGVRAVLDRFRQIEPTVLLAVDSYRYGPKVVDRTAELAEIRAGLPSLAATVVLPYGQPDRPLPEGAVPWSAFVAADGPLAFEAVPFDHPLYVLYSSGTTGLPKPIVHGHGGILLEHVKCIGLHGDMGPTDRFFWFSTTGWMMWNYLVSGLLVGATVVLFDGDPASPDLGKLWRLAADERVTWFGVSAPFLMSCRKAGLRPGDDVDLSALRAVGSTGAPLPTDGFRWVYDAVGDVLLSSISGGTDVCTAFVGATPMVPVWAGEIPARYLGARVEAYDDGGRSVVGEQGELVITAPMPSMPVGFWGDADGSRYRAAYFETYPGVWRHGDWITITDRGSCIITGRSDATLNRGGVRLGTSEFYAVVEGLPEVADSLVVHLEDGEGGAGRLVLLVVPTAGTAGSPDLQALIAGALRANLSPRHVPDEVHWVRAVPRTLSGKKLELPVKRILLGALPSDVASPDALVDPTALDDIATLATARRH